MVAPNSPSPSPAEPPEDDPMGPPKVPCEVECIHCGNRYLSSEIRWRPDPDGPGGGWWVCPVDGCDGAGFCFDIFPTDPDVARAFGVETSWDDEEDEYDDEGDDADGDGWKDAQLAGEADEFADEDGELPFGDSTSGGGFLSDRAADDPSERPPPPRRRLTDDEPFTDDDIPF